MTEAVASPEDRKRFLSDGGIALTVYVLYLIGFVTGITAVVGALVAHLYRRSASPQVATHFRFQIRTFWFGVICFVLGWLLWHFFVGIPILLWWFVWTLVRVIRGMLLLNDGKAIPNPKSFLFGGAESNLISPSDSLGGTATGPKQLKGRSMLVLIVAVVAISILALELGLVDAFWRGFIAGLTDTN